MPENHYGRKMFGYLYAIRNGAEVIIDTDDDNLPKPDYEFPAFDGHYVNTSSDLGFVNIYRHFTEDYIWPRGLPLRRISDRSPVPTGGEKASRIGVWQGLADEDPDVDAVYRMTIQKPCFFKDLPPVVLAKGTMAPVNSQNTAFRKEMFPLLYLPAFVTFRFTDILRGFIAQPVMWESGFNLGFMKAIVVQKRNEHDFFKDFVSEVPMYLHGEEAMETARTAAAAKGSTEDRIYECYRALEARKIVQKDELALLEAWLKGIAV
jgi:hypothetical protein